MLTLERQNGVRSTPRYGSCTSAGLTIRQTRHVPWGHEEILFRQAFKFELWKTWKIFWWTYCCEINLQYLLFRGAHISSPSSNSVRLMMPKNKRACLKVRTSLNTHPITDGLPERMTLRLYLEDISSFRVLFRKLQMIIKRLEILEMRQKLWQSKWMLLRSEKPERCVRKALHCDSKQQWSSHAMNWTARSLLEPLGHCLFAPHIYIVVLLAHPVGGESHNQRNAGEVTATSPPFHNEPHRSHVIFVKVSHNTTSTSCSQHHVVVIGKARVVCAPTARLQQYQEVAFMCERWNDILQRFNKCSILLQSSSIELTTAVSLMKSLDQFVTECREMFDCYGVETYDRSGNKSYKFESEACRAPKRKKHFSEGSAVDALQELSRVKKLKVSTFSVTIDHLINALKQPIKSYSFVQQPFGVRTEFDLISDEDIKIATKRLVDNYPKDLFFEFYPEFCQFICWNKEQSTKYSREEPTGIAQHICKLLQTNGVYNAFPNTEVTFRIYLSLMSTNCSGERSFSQLARIKNVKRLLWLKITPTC